jgi:hypothetical protein
MRPVRRARFLVVTAAASAVACAASRSDLAPPEPASRSLEPPRVRFASREASPRLGIVIPKRAAIIASNVTKSGLSAHEARRTLSSLLEVELPKILLAKGWCSEAVVLDHKRLERRRGIDQVLSLESIRIGEDGPSKLVFTIDFALENGDRTLSMTSRSSVRVTGALSAKRLSVVVSAFANDLVDRMPLTGSRSMSHELALGAGR